MAGLPSRPTVERRMSSSRTREVIVVGAGFAGVGAAIKLRQAGADFLVLEKANEIGGVWRDNTYPDCGCDVPSAFYSYSFAPNPGWTAFFSKQAEIKAYARETAEKYGVMEHLVAGWGIERSVQSACVWSAVLPGTASPSMLVATLHHLI